MKCYLLENFFSLLCKKKSSLVVSANTFMGSTCTKVIPNIVQELGVIMCHEEEKVNTQEAVCCHQKALEVYSLNKALIMPIVSLLQPASAK